MKNTKTTKHALLSSFVALFLCVAMLAGTTFAWFTDSVSSGVNTIHAGNLDIELYHTSASVTTAASIENETKLFRDVNGNAMLWEPGAMSYETFTVKNEGSLALKYKLAMNILDYNALDGHTLKEVLKVKVLTDGDMLGNITRDAVQALDWSTTDTLDVFNTAGNLEAGESDVFQVIVYWAPGAGDNNLNVNNGKTTSDGQPLFINFGINVVASQLNHENDSFGSDYDQGIALPDLPVSVNKVFQSVPITGDNVTESVEVKNVSTNVGVATVQAESVNAVIGALKDQATDIATDSDLSTVIYLKVDTADQTETSVTYNIDLYATLTYKDTNGTTQTTTLNSLNNNLADKIVTATMDIGKGLSNVTVKHHDTPMTQLTSANTNAEGYYYNKTTGVLTIKSKSFSPFTVDYTIEGVAAVGNTTYSTLEEAMNAAQDGDTVMLLKDIAETAEYVIDKTLILDFNGKTLGDSQLTINGASVTLTGNGTLSSTTYSPIFMTGGTLTLAGVNISTGEKDAITISNNGAAATVNIVIADDTENRIIATGNGCDGIFVNATKDISLDITGGAAKTGKLTLSGVNAAYHAYPAGGKVNANISGFEVAVNGKVSSGNGCTLKISDITGSFDTDVTDYCTAGYCTSVDENGRYAYGPISAENAVCCIIRTDDTRIYLMSLEQAMMQVSDGDTIQLQKDVFINAQTSDGISAANVTFDLNQKTITARGTWLIAKHAGSYKYAPISATIKNGTYVLNGTSSGKIRFEKGSAGIFENVTFKSSNGTFYQAIQTYATNQTGEDELNEYSFADCTFIDCYAGFEGSSGSCNKYVVSFTDCEFTAEKMSNGAGFIKTANYVYGTLLVDNCSFNATATGNSPAAIKLETGSSVGENKLNVTVNNITFTGTSTGTGMYRYTPVPVSATYLKYVTVTETGTNSYTTDGNKVPVDGFIAISGNGSTPNVISLASKLPLVGYSPKNIVTLTYDGYTESVALADGNVFIVPAGITYGGTVTPASGYALHVETDENGTTTYTAYSCTVGETRYYDFAAAVNAAYATNGEVLLACDSNKTITLKPGVTFNTNGKNYTGTVKASSADYAVCYDSETGIYSVVEAVAKANNVGYMTLNEAAANATTNNYVITLLKDSDESFTLPVDKSPRITFNTNGKNYTGTVSAPEGYTLAQYGNYIGLKAATLTVGDTSTDFVYYNLFFDNAAREMAATTGGRLTLHVDYEKDLWIKGSSAGDVIFDKNGHTCGLKAWSTSTMAEQEDGTFLFKLK